jgi:tetratricopeptide (TPR) repeat protein
MIKRSLTTVILTVLLTPVVLHAESYLNFTQGVEAYKEHQWMQAMSAFLDVLHEDPQNSLAHKYMDAIAQEISIERRTKVQKDRMHYLEGAADVLKAPPTSPVNTALSSLANADEDKKEDRWREKLDEAHMHKDLGQLLPANDLVLQILAEKPDYREALLELGDLQARLRKALDSGSLLVLEERFSYEGFYAYGQADYAAAATAWNKARAIVDQSATGNERKNHMKALCFEAYEKIAQAHVDEEKDQAELRSLFNQGVAAYDQDRYEEALDLLRRLALRDPDYPQLALYLVQAETGADKMRSQRLGEEKRKELVALYEKGVEQLEKENFDEAEKDFAHVLVLDPSHSQARTYLAMAKAENIRRHDPKAAQMHYETGLIAYASGKLDEAVREWTIAIRMNPEHPKARIALAKVQKELALSKEVPDTQ